MYGITWLKKIKNLNPNIIHHKGMPMNSVNYFPIALKFVLDAEGGFVDNFNDPGQATNQGVTQAVYDTYRSSINQPPQSVADITPFDVTQIYRVNYWLAGSCDKILSQVSVCHFNVCVNSGVEQAGKLLQRAAGVAQVDGIVGPNTLTAVNAINPVDLCNQYIQEIKDFYNRLCINAPNFQEFLQGWLNRTADLNNLLISLE